MYNVVHLYAAMFAGFMLCHFGSGGCRWLFRWWWVAPQLPSSPPVTSPAATSVFYNFPILEKFRLTVPKNGFGTYEQNLNLKMPRVKSVRAVRELWAPGLPVMCVSETLPPSLLNVCDWQKVRFKKNPLEKPSLR